MGLVNHFYSCSCWLIRQFIQYSRKPCHLRFIEYDFQALIVSITLSSPLDYFLGCSMFYYIFHERPCHLSITDHHSWKLYTSRHVLHYLFHLHFWKVIHHLIILKSFPHLFFSFYQFWAQLTWEKQLHQHLEQLLQIR